MRTANALDGEAAPGGEQRAGRPFHGLLLGLLYGVLLSAGAVLCMGPGDGTFVPYIWACAPLLLLDRVFALFFSPLYWGACGLLAGLNRPRRGWAFLLLLLVLHYAAAVSQVCSDEFFKLSKLREGIALVIPFAAIYLTGQVMLWLAVSRGVRSARPNAIMATGTGT